MTLYRTEGGVQIELTPQEEAEHIAKTHDWNANVKPGLVRKQTFLDAKRSSLNFDEEETDIAVACYFEVKLIRLALSLGQPANSVDTPVLDAFNAVFPGQTKLQIAQTIENRVENYLTVSATALANKIKDGG